MSGHLSPARIVLLVTSPRLPAGLLTAAAWDLIRTHPVFTSADTEQTTALRSAGVTITVTGDGVTDLLAAAADGGTAVWLSGPTGDEQLARTLGLRLAREAGLAELELMYGSWDPPGARLLDAVTVMDRLASPGGDPWKRQQTHRSLAKYMVEEVYEAYDAIDDQDYPALREELGDVLLQVVLHARLAEELPDGQAWTIDDVAGDLVDKLIRRNPHVFAGAAVETVEEITEQWERIKKAEKAGASAMDSIARSQPALSLAAKVQIKAARAGFDVTGSTVEPAAGSPSDFDVTNSTVESAAGLPSDDAVLGERLWSIVAEATAAGLDAEAALRRIALARMGDVRAQEHCQSDPADR